MWIKSSTGTWVNLHHLLQIEVVYKAQEWWIVGREAYQSSYYHFSSHGEKGMKTEHEAEDLLGRILSIGPLDPGSFDPVAYRTDLERAKEILDLQKEKLWVSFGVTQDDSSTPGAGS